MNKDTLVKDAEFSIRVQNCLANARFYGLTEPKTLGDLEHIPRSKLAEIKNLGPVSLREIDEVLEEAGLRRAVKLPAHRRSPEPVTMDKRIFQIFARHNEQSGSAVAFGIAGKEARVVWGGDDEPSRFAVVIPDRSVGLLSGFADLWPAIADQQEEFMAFTPEKLVSLLKAHGFTEAV